MSLVCPDKSPEPLLISKVVFDIIDRDKVIEALSIRPEFMVLEKKEEQASSILWLEKPRAPQTAQNRRHSMDGSNPVLLGIMTLGRKRLILECASRTLASVGREILTDVSGSNLRYRITTYEKLTSALKEKTAIKDSVLIENFYHRLQPEFFKSYFEVHWIHEKIPALGGLTPLQCARSRRKKEREALAAILATFKKSSLTLYDFDRLIDILGFKDHPWLQEDHFTKQKLKEKILAVIDKNQRFLAAVSQAAINMPAFNAIRVRRLAEGNLILQGLIHYLEKSKRTTAELSQLAKILEQIEEMTQILQTETVASTSNKKMIEKIINDPTLNHRHVITKKMINTVAREIEKAWRENTECKSIGPDISLTTALNKTPAVWVAAISENLGLPPQTTKGKNIELIAENLSGSETLHKVVQKLAALSMSAVTALNLIYTNGGTYLYGDLIELFGSEEMDGYFWGRKRPTSPLGLLRSHGLLFVGQLKKGNYCTKGAVIPMEIRQNLSFLENMSL